MEIEGSVGMDPTQSTTERKVVERSRKNFPKLALMSVLAVYPVREAPLNG